MLAPGAARSPRRRGLAALALAAGLALALPMTAAAHPHVFVDARFALVTDDDGGLTAIDVTWRFDAIYTQVVVPDFDADGDGRLSPAEAEELAGVFFDGLGEYDYFTRVTLDGEPVQTIEARAAAARLDGERLVVSFTIPLAGGRPDRVELIAFDEEVFVAYDVAPDDGAAAGRGTALACQSQDFDLDSWYLGPVSVRGVVCQREPGA